MDRLSELLGQAVQFVYTCWDRIVLSGYIERLQRPENLIHFFHDVVGIEAIEPAVLEQRTNAYKTWVRRITDELGRRPYHPVCSGGFTARHRELGTLVVHGGLHFVPTGMVQRTAIRRGTGFQSTIADHLHQRCEDTDDVHSGRS